MLALPSKAASVRLGLLPKLFRLGAELACFVEAAVGFINDSQVVWANGFIVCPRERNADHSKLWASKKPLAHTTWLSSFQTPRLKGIRIFFPDAQ